jgi:hypothetical protein
MRFQDSIINVHSVLEVSFQPRFAVNRPTFKRIQTQGSFGTQISQESVYFHLKNTGFREKNPSFEMSPKAAFGCFTGHVLHLLSPSIKLNLPANGNGLFLKYVRF